MTSVEAEAGQARLLVVITFHYNRSRLRELFQVMKALSGFKTAVLDVIVATNTTQGEEIESVRRLCGPLVSSAAASSECCKSLDVRSFPGLDDPLSLPWAHKPVTVGQFLDGRYAYTHYVSLEDDIEFSFANFCYFLQYRKALRHRGLLPAYFRVEYNFSDDQLYCTDLTGVTETGKRPVARFDGFEFMNVDNPYQAMFVLDQELAREYVASQSFDVEASKRRMGWGIRERAAMGLTFESVPQGFHSRLVVPVDPFDLSVPSFAYVYHVTNNYTNEQGGVFGRLLVTRLFAKGGP